MFSPDISLMLVKEKHKDILRDLAQQRLIAEAGLQHSNPINSPRQAIARLGEQMVRLGAKLQSLDAPSSTENLVVKKA